MSASSEAPPRCTPVKHDMTWHGTILTSPGSVEKGIFSHKIHGDARNQGFIQGGFWIPSSLKKHMVIELDVFFAANFLPIDVVAKESQGCNLYSGKNLGPRELTEIKRNLIRATKNHFAQLENCLKHVKTHLDSSEKPSI